MHPRGPYRTPRPAPLALTAALLAVLLLPGTTGAQDLVADIDVLVESIRTAYSIPGLGLAIVRNGSLLMTKGYGKTRMDSTGEDVTEDTLFYIASTTKAMTSALISQILANSSKYSLDTPVREIMPSFYQPELYRQEMVSVRDLLSHNTGMSDIIYNWMLGGDVNTRQECIDRARFFSPVYPLRQRTYYNNLMYTAAGLLLERLDPPLSWEEAMTAHIFTPLGMTGSGFMNELSPAQEALLATPYEADWLDGYKLREVERRFFAKVSLGAPAGSVVSSARDWSKWLLMLAHGGVNEAGGRVIDSDVLRGTFEPWSITGPQRGEAPFSETGEAYGLGWYPGFYHGERQLEHAGYMFGYHSLATFFPDLGLALLSCANGQLGSGLEDLHDRISDLILAEGAAKGFPGGAEVPARHHSNPDLGTLRPLPSAAEAARARERLVAARARAAREEPRDVTEYVGVYGNFALGNASVVVNPRTQLLEVQYGDFARTELFPQGDPDSFLGKVADPIFFAPLVEVFFKRSSPGGEVVSFSVDLGPLPFDTPVMQRGLRMSDAPAPLEPPVCEHPDMSQASRVRGGRLALVWP